VKTTLIVLAVLIVAALAAAFALGPNAVSGLSSIGPTTEGVEVRVEQAARSTLTEMVKAPGTIEPKKSVDISAEVAARVEELPVEEGDRVSKGEVVVRLDDRDLLAALESAKARRDGEQYRLQSEQARLQGLLSTLSYAKKELQRKQTLYDSGDISRKELDDAMERVEDLQATVDATKYSISTIESNLVSAKADIDQAEEALSKTVIAAPIDGVITALNAEEGEVVLVGTMNNPGTVIMTIADLDRMLLTAEVSENDINKVDLGQTAKVYVNGYPDEVFSGTVTNIALQRSVKADGSGYFKTEIELDLQGKLLRSGHTANVDIEVAEHDGIVVPSQAILDRALDQLPDRVRQDPLVDRRKSVTYVAYIVEDGKARLRAVEPGPSNLTEQIIAKGVEEGEQVVVGPYTALLETLSDGAAVSVLDDDAAEVVEEGDNANVVAGDGGARGTSADSESRRNGDDSESRRTGGEDS